MCQIIISPWAQSLGTGRINPKDYPFWAEVVASLRDKGHHVIQIGLPGEYRIGASEVQFGLSLKNLVSLVGRCDVWASVDNFFPHLCHPLNKEGVVVWGKSNPDIFGYPGNTNLVRDKKFFRPHQFNFWKDEAYDPSVFVPPEVVTRAIFQKIDNIH